MTDLTERLGAIQARVDAATPGPWEVADDALSDGDWMVREVDPGPDMPDDVAAVISHEATAEFIAAAPSDVAFLLDLARKQGAALEALSQWADRNKTGYYDEAQDDVVQIIRPALEAKP